MAELTAAVNSYRNLFDAWRWKEVPTEWRNTLLRYRRMGQWQVWHSIGGSGGTWAPATSDDDPSNVAVYRMNPNLQGSYCDIARWRAPTHIALEVLRVPYAWPPGTLPTIPEYDMDDAPRYPHPMFREETAKEHKEMTMAQGSDKSAVLVVETITFVNKVPVAAMAADEQVALVLAQQSKLAELKAAAEVTDLKALKAEIKAREAGLLAFQKAANANAPA